MQPGRYRQAATVQIVCQLHGDREEVWKFFVGAGARNNME